MITLLSRLFIPDYENYSSPKVRQAYGILTGSVGIFFNFFLFVLKIVAGMISHSIAITADAVSYTHLRAHETDSYLVCRLLLEKKKKKIEIAVSYTHLLYQIEEFYLLR